MWSGWKGLAKKRYCVNLFSFISFFDYNALRHEDFLSSRPLYVRSVFALHRSCAVNTQVLLALPGCKTVVAPMNSGCV